MSTKTALLEVDKTSSQGSPATAQISIQGDGIHVATRTPSTGDINTTCQKLAGKHMCHGFSYDRVKRNALLHERCHVGALGVACIIHIQLIQRKEGHTTKLFILETLHQTSRGRVSINNYMEQGILSSNLHSSLILFIRQLKVLHHQAKVLHAHLQPFTNYNLFQGIQSHRSSTWHTLTHIKQGLPANFLGLGNLVTNLIDGTPLFLTRVSHFSTLSLLLVHCTFEILQQLGLLLKFLAFG